MGGVLAELLVQKGAKVTLVTPANLVSEWALNTLEQIRIQSRMIELGVTIVTAQAVSAVGAKGVTLSCAFTGRKRELACDAVVLVTTRLPEDALWHDLKARDGEWAAAGIKSVRRIGDADAPAPIAWATYAGHRFARELDGEPLNGALSFRREVTEITAVE